MAILLPPAALPVSDPRQTSLSVPQDHLWEHSGEIALGNLEQVTVPDSGLAISISGKFIPAHAPISILVDGHDMFINGISLRGNSDIAMLSEQTSTPGQDSLTISVRRLAPNDDSPLQQGFDYIIRNIEHAVARGGTLLVGLTRHGQIYCGLIPQESDPSYAESREMITKMIQLTERFSSDNDGQ